MSFQIDFEPQNRRKTTKYRPKIVRKRSGASRRLREAPRRVPEALQRLPAHGAPEPAPRPADKGRGHVGAGKAIDHQGDPLPHRPSPPPRRTLPDRVPIQVQTARLWLQARQSARACRVPRRGPRAVPASSRRQHSAGGEACCAGSERPSQSAGVGVGDA